MIDLDKVNLSTKVKFYPYYIGGAPELRDDWGSLVKVLKNALVDGIPPVQVSSYQVKGELLEITMPESAGVFPYNTVIKVTGADQSDINTEYRVLVSAKPTYTVSIRGKSSYVTGTLSVSVPSLGWELAYDKVEEQGVACFKSKAPTPKILKVRDKCPQGVGYNEEWAKFARLSYGLTINDQGSFPVGRKAPILPNGDNEKWPNPEDDGYNPGRLPGFNVWFYSVPQAQNIHTGNSYTQYNYSIKDSNRALQPYNWYVIGTDQGFYLFNSYHKNYHPGNVNYFGEYNRLGDNVHNCLLIASNQNYHNSGYQNYVRYNKGAINSGFSYRNQYQDRGLPTRYAFNSLTDVDGNYKNNALTCNQHYWTHNVDYPYTKLDGTTLTVPYFITDIHSNYLIGSLKGFSVPLGTKSLQPYMFGNYGKVFQISFSTDTSEDCFAFINLENFD